MVHCQEHAMILCLEPEHMYPQQWPFCQITRTPGFLFSQQLDEMRLFMLSDPLQVDHWQTIASGRMNDLDRLAVMLNKCCAQDFVPTL
jgi:hypothetical protein